MLNAAFHEFMKFGEITAEHFDKTYGVKDLLFGFQKVLPLLQKGASVNFTSLGRWLDRHSEHVGLLVYQGCRAQPGARLDARHQGVENSHNVLSTDHTLTPGLQALIPEEAVGGIVDTTPLSRLGPRTTCARPLCSWPPTTAPTSPASSSMAASRNTEQGAQAAIRVRFHDPSATRRREASNSGECYGHAEQDR
jgi:hypothetical protein